MTGTPVQQEGPGKLKKKCKKGGPGTFWFDKGEAEGFFSFLGGFWDRFWWGCTLSAYHAFDIN